MSLSFRYFKEGTRRLRWLCVTFGTGLGCGAFYGHGLVESLLLFPSLSGMSFGFVAHAPTDLFEVLFRVLLLTTLCACIPTFLWTFFESLHPGLQRSESWMFHTHILSFLGSFCVLLWGSGFFLLIGISCLTTVYGIDLGHQEIHTGLLPLLRGLAWVRFLWEGVFLLFWIFLFCTSLPFFVHVLGYTLIDLEGLRKIWALGTLVCLSLAMPTPDVFLGLLGIWMCSLFLFEMSLSLLFWAHVRQGLRKRTSVESGGDKKIKFFLLNKKYFCSKGSQERGRMKRDSNPRYFRMSVFKTDAFDHSAIHPREGGSSRTRTYGLSVKSRLLSH